MNLNTDWNYKQAYLLFETSDYNNLYVEEPIATEPNIAEQNVDASYLVGLWSTNKTSDAKFDIYGNLIELTYSGSWYKFSEDGKFTYTIVFNEEYAQYHGDYTVDGNKIYVTNGRMNSNIGSPLDADDETYEFYFEEYEGEITLMIADSMGYPERC